MVRDDDIGTLGLQMLPTAHFKSKTQQILDVSNHETDDPKREKKVKYSEYVLVTYDASVLHITNQSPVKGRNKSGMCQAI